jgi:radical SAM protein with 4Fe4S-binding SPASM domain
MTVLCDGRVASCEQDALGRQVMGRVGEQSVEEIWRRSFGGLRTDHREGNWKKRPVCAGCREWHRP